MSQEAERSEPVVEGNDDDAARDQAARVVIITLIDHKGAAVDPHHDR